MLHVMLCCVQYHALQWRKNIFQKLWIKGAFTSPPHRFRASFFHFFWRLLEMRFLSTLLLFCGIFPLDQTNILMYLISAHNSFVNNHELFKKSKLQFLYQHLNVLLLHYLYKLIFVCVKSKTATRHRLTF